MARKRRHDTATITISLPDPVKDWVEDQVAKGVSESSDDFIADLVPRERRCMEQTRHAPPSSLDELRVHLAEAAYSSTSDYVRDFVRRDRKRREARETACTIEELRDLVADARAGGASGVWVADVRKAGQRIAKANGWLDERA